MFGLLFRFSHKVLLFILSIVARAILLIIGWSLLSDDIFQQLNEHQRTVLVFSHTSYMDFYILTLYLIAYPTQLGHVRTMVKPQPFAYAGWLLRRFGAIPATALGDKQGGGTVRVVAELRSQDRWVFLISPKGTIVKQDWRSGYYYIAKEFGAHFIVAGADYEKKCIIISKAIAFNQCKSPPLKLSQSQTSLSDEALDKRNEEVVRKLLQEELKQIVPLYPDDEVVPIRDHDSNKRGLISNFRLTLLILAAGILLRKITG